MPYHKFAELIGLKGIYVDDAERMGAAWDEALAADRPVVIEVKTDPNVPPLPPHITMAQAKAFATTLMKGDPDAGPRAARHREAGAERGAAGAQGREKK